MPSESFLTKLCSHFHAYFGLLRQIVLHFYENFKKYLSNCFRDFQREGWVK